MTTQANRMFQKVALDQPLNPELGLKVSSPSATRAALGDAFLYAQPVESEARFSRAVAETVVPNMDALLADFFEVWEPQELSHGQIETHTLSVMELTPKEQVDKVSVPHNVARIISSYSPGFHDVAQLVVAIYAALGEKEVTIAYPRMAAIAHSIGEHALAIETLLPMARQEANHLGFYLAFSRERWDQLKPWQQWAVRKIIELGYWPVGVQRSNSDRKQGFGRMLLALEPAEPMDIAKKVETVAGSLLHAAYDESGFLQKRYQACIDELHENQPGRGDRT